MNDTLLKQYLLNVKKLLPCSSREKKRCIIELEADASAFLENHSNATMAELYSAIGSPESIAKSLMDRLSPNEISNKLSTKRKIVVGILAIVIVLAAIVAVFVAVTANKRQVFYDGYYVETFESTPDNADPAPSALSTY